MKSNGDTLKDFPTGPTCNCLCSRPSLDDQLHPVSPTILFRPVRDQHMPNDCETFVFDGLLSIGTLGSSPIIEEEEAEAIQEPVVVISVLEAIAEKEESETVTETHLQVMNVELEKVLTEAAEKEGGRLSSARPSHVSSKANEACPLQEFLLSSSAMELAQKERIEKRVSLEDLLMKEKGGEIGLQNEGTGVSYMLRKTVKRHRSNRDSLKCGGGGGSGAGAGGGGGGGGAILSNSKFDKILQMFHKKVYPENKMASKKYMKFCNKHKSKDTNSCTETRSTSKKSCKERNTKLCCGSDHTCSLMSSSMSSSREQWIKTDADYLVLEL